MLENKSYLLASLADIQAGLCFLPTGNEAFIMTITQNLSRTPFEPGFENNIAEKLAALLCSAPFEEQNIGPEAVEELKKLFRASEFAYRICVQFPAYVKELIDGDVLLREYGYEDYFQMLVERCGDEEDEVKLGIIFRQFRNQQMLRLAWRDMVRNIDVEIILAELSCLADACIHLALEKISALCKAEYGKPVNSEGRVIELVVLAMGKLGAHELNYSSDIDLIFCYSDDGEISRPVKNKTISHNEFFTRLSRRFIRLLNENTAHGFVYRVDTRLRPFGDSGQLALSFSAMEAYYERHGREWERYAMIKARAISLDEHAALEITRRLHPFVYRRYLDFGVFESLREMKELIETELKRKGATKNVKLGPGGIREIEFIGQAFQLIRGGRTPELQIRPILGVLAVLQDQSLIPDYVYTALRSSYVFLRKVENAIQAFDDRQTHLLPDAVLPQLRLAYAVGFDCWEAFEGRLKSTMQTVHEIFEQVFSAPQLQTFGQKGDENSYLAEQIWAEKENDALRLDILTALGYGDVQKALQLIKGFQNGVVYKSASPQSQHRVDQLMPLVLVSVAQTDKPDICLLRLIDLMEAITKRSAYIALLSEHPMGLSQLVQLVAKSEWISSILVRSPVLLDELLDARRLYEISNKTDLAQELKVQMQLCENDVEQQMRCLSEFKQSNVFRVAASELSGVMPVNKISDQLTDIAEIVLATVEQLSLAHVIARHGKPEYIREKQQPQKQLASFCVIAYGKMGGIELGFSSDLDLVFLHDSQGMAQLTSGGEHGEKVIDNGLFFARVAQRIMYFLNTRTQNGVLYEVDTRLRPSGGAGILVSNLQSFSAYQHKKAWTWEHQALIRARAVTGNPKIREEFNQIRREVLTQKRDHNELKKDVSDMRKKMRKELFKNRTGLFNIKQSVGGITDIEFIIQFLALAWANKYPDIIEYTDNLRILESLVKNAILCDEDAKILSTAYLAYREKAHINTLQGRSLDVELGDFIVHQQGVEKIWHALLEQNES